MSYNCHEKSECMIVPMSQRSDSEVMGDLPGAIWLGSGRIQAQVCPTPRPGPPSTLGLPLVLQKLSIRIMCPRIHPSKTTTKQIPSLDNEISSRSPVLSVSAGAPCGGLGRNGAVNCRATAGRPGTESWGESQRLHLGRSFNLRRQSL